MRRSIEASVVVSLTLWLGCTAAAQSGGADVTLAPVRSATSAPSTEPTSVASASPKPADPPLAGWQRFTHRTGTYAIMMPVAPDQTDTQAPTAAGIRTLHTASADLGDSMYMAQFAEIGDTTPDLDSAVKGLSIRNASTKTVKFQGKYEGREVEGTADGTNVSALVFVAAQRFFILLCVGPASAPTVRAFWDSFELSR